MNLFKLQNFNHALTLPLLVVLFVALIALSNLVLQGHKLDLTEDKLFTLNEGTYRLLNKIDTSLNFYFFFSEQVSRERPEIRNYALRVREVLEEFAANSNDHIKLHFVDPEPFSETEDRATRLGIQAVVLPSGRSLYFGLAATNSLDGVEVIPFLQPEKEDLLEYEIDKMIYRLVEMKRPVVALMTSLDMSPPAIDPATGQRNNPWVIAEQMRQLFELRLIDQTIETIAPEVKVLMVVHPKDLQPKTLYAIDQFIMRGGRALFFVDPFAEVEDVVQQPRDFSSPKYKSSSLNELFRKWGFEVPEKIVADPPRSLQVNTSKQQRFSHFSMLGMTAADFDKNDVVMQHLQILNFALSSYVKPYPDDSKVQLESLVHTGQDSALLDISSVPFLSSQEMLRNVFRSAKKEPNLSLAARISGDLKSAFGTPPVTPDATSTHLKSTQTPANLVVVADVDILSDRMWVNVQSFFGQRIVQAFAGNGTFVLNVIENLSGSSDLIGIRGREAFFRPFTRVSEIEAAANKRYRKTEEKLQGELRITEAKLSELQAKRSDANSPLLTAEQRREVNKFRENVVVVRKKLREVRHEQNKDIEELGTRLKIFNIGLIPTLVVMVALVVALFRKRKRSRSL